MGIARVEMVVERSKRRLWRLWRLALSAAKRKLRLIRHLSRSLRLAAVASRV